MADTNSSVQSASPAGAGVQVLIDRLKSEGIAAGRDEGDAILAEAKAKAGAILAAAEREARETLEKARAEAAQELAAGRDSLQIAARDLVLSLRNELGTRIQEEASRLIATAMADEAFLQKLIIAMAGKAKEAAAITQADKMEIVLPDRVVSFEELKQSPEAVEPGTLTHFVIALAGDVLRKGVSFSAEPGFSGIKVRLKEKDITIDITDEAVAALLTKHLQPRLRAVMEGVLR
ncbi:hypothetical protein [Roseibium sp.]|uniref:hypothetical protein n=1 Tax=Roseibium sp. TaxID=1936156 RepID=UPI003A96D2D3